jgi:DMSO/TMAO reductase YedYZ molybdopterin-dependent catalytic subunit/mono/diheme cytochrome c family protein
MKPLLCIFSVVSFGLLWATPALIKQNTRPLQAESNLDALDPWETPIASFFIRSHHGVPTLPEKWEVEIDGLVENPTKIDLKSLQEMPQKKFHAVLECSGNGRGFHFPKVSGLQWEKGAVGNGEWTGVPFQEILKLVKPKPNAKYARFEGADLPALPTVPAFIRSIPVDKLMAPDTLLALKMNRDPLPLLHGGPVRLVVPNWYAHNWIKWVKKITFQENEDSGFFMKKGYRMPKTPVKPGEKWDSATGVPVTTIRVQSFILHPRSEEEVPLGKVQVLGKTFSGTGTISKVEISIDKGKHWTQAKLEEPHADGGWQEFEALVDIKKTGKALVMARATDTAGNVQPLVGEWNPSGYLWNAVDKVAFQVTKKTSPKLIGESIAEERCLTCHTKSLLSVQELSKEGWEKVLGKMETFGVKLTPEEKTSLVEYFVKRGPQPKQVEIVDYNKESEIHETRGRGQGDASKGEKLFATNCASCHGEKAEGKIGPTLRGRHVPENYFYEVVIKGIRSMPAFEDSLSQAQARDIREYLLQ